MKDILEYSDNIIYAIEELNVLSKYKDDEIEFKNKLEELNFENTEFSFEGILGTVIEYIVNS